MDRYNELALMHTVWGNGFQCTTKASADPTGSFEVGIAPQAPLPQRWVWPWVKWFSLAEDNYLRWSHQPLPRPSGGGINTRSGWYISPSTMALPVPLKSICFMQCIIKVTILGYRLILLPGWKKRKVSRISYNPHQWSQSWNWSSLFSSFYLFWISFTLNWHLCWSMWLIGWPTLSSMPLKVIETILVHLPSKLGKCIKRCSSRSPGSLP